MSIIPWFDVVAAVLLLIGIVRGSARSGGGAYDEDDPNQFVKDELDPSNPDNLMLRQNHDLDAEDLHIHAISTTED